MYCQKCKKKFYIKRGFLDLFDTKTRYICDKCLNDLPISLKLEIIPLDVGNIKVVSLFDTIYRVDLNPYILEINQIYNFFRKKYRSYEILFLDYLLLTYFNLELLSFWVESFDKPLLIICGVLKK